jgi:hypothetical protein
MDCDENSANSAGVVWFDRLQCRFSTDKLPLKATVLVGPLSVAHFVYLGRLSGETHGQTDQVSLEKADRHPIALPKPFPLAQAAPTLPKQEEG